MAERQCAHCREDLPAKARKDSLYCGVSCRSAASRDRRIARERATAAGGSLCEATRRKLASVDPDYERDPMAVHILQIAAKLDSGEVAAASLNAMSKAWREAYKDYVRMAESAASPPSDPLEAAGRSIQDKLTQLRAVA